jgi:hypothetical protein
MSRAILALLLVSGLWAQNPRNPFDKAPPDVDEALRDRITKFYQAHVDRKFRQADQYVAEDTKDFYYEANKPTYQAFEIKSITYSDNFSKAKAIVNCKMRVMIPGFSEEPVMVPTPSVWKLENGQWFWYVDQSQGRETPFGRMKPATEAPAGGGVLPSLSSGPDIQALWKNVRADKNLVQLKAAEESSGEVTISSKMPGNVKLRLDYSKSPGLEVSLDRDELKSGEQAKVSFRQKPQKNASAKTTEVRVLVQPTNQMIPIRVEIQ